MKIVPALTATAVLVMGSATLASYLSSSTTELKGSTASNAVIENKTPERDDWVTLFDGTSLDAWQPYSGAQNHAWSVENEMLVVRGSKGKDAARTDLMTKQQFENFELSLEWKVTEGANSGIFWGVQKIEGTRWAHESGIEIQIVDNDGNPEGEIPTHRAGACFDLYAPQEEAALPAGSFNHSRLRVEDGMVQHWLNGTQIVSFDMTSPDYQNRLQNSKFSSWAHFGKYTSGHVALQDHGDTVAFKNIKIRALE